MKKKSRDMEHLKEIVGEEVTIVPIMEQSRRIVRVQKHERQKSETTIEINAGIVGDSIETMLERIREGEGEEGIPDRDLVYNDNESSTVNPITNIRSDKFDLMNDEKAGEYEHRHRKMKVVKDDPEPEEGKDSPTEGSEQLAKE